MVALPVPLRRLFEYKAQPSNTKVMTVGSRVKVHFGPRTMIGVIVEINQQAQFNVDKIRAIDELIDDDALLSPAILKLAKWASDYYHQAIGEVVRAALPTFLGDSKAVEMVEYFRLCGNEDAQELLKNAPAQQKLFEFLQTKKQATSSSYELSLIHERWRPIIKQLMDKGLVESYKKEAITSQQDQFEPIPILLNAEQQQVFDELSDRLDRFNVAMVDGITGSGKTRLYTKLIKHTLKQGKQALLLVPEISLTPQLIEQLKRQLNLSHINVLHSSLSDKARRQAWQGMQSGQVRIVVGTRSALFVPMLRPGLIIIDEEHDPSYKQQEGFRYHARDLAVMRGKFENIPVILGSATPSLESMHNVEVGKYSYHRLLERASGASLPIIHLVDLNNTSINDGLTPQLIDAINDTVEKKQQVMIFINRRGFAPVMMCTQCAWIAACDRCNARMTQHKNHLACHHCGSKHKLIETCPNCDSSKMMAVGEGTQRVEERLQKMFKNASIARLDGDSIAKKGKLDEILKQIREGRVDIIVGTQILSKGHDFPGVTLVGIINPDSALFSIDFRATELMMQSILQVAGRAGRGDKKGQVMIQTAFPDHKIYQQIIHHDYNQFVKDALLERKQAQFPPWHSMAIIRAAAINPDLPMQFLGSCFNDAKFLSQNTDHIKVNQPLPAPMEKRQGLFWAQLIISSSSRAHMQQLLDPLIEKIESSEHARKVRWSIDVDPISTY